jgi:hypothetical protein
MVVLHVHEFDTHLIEDRFNEMAHSFQGLLNLL